MMYDDVYLINDTLTLASPRDVEEAQTYLCANFPKGYKEFVTTLGLGTFCGNIYISMPTTIGKSASDLREQWKRHYYWDDARDVLSKSQVLDSIPLGCSDCGDYIIFRQHPPTGIYVLNDVYEIHRAGGNFDDALEWLHQNVGFMPPGKFKYFNSGHEGAMIEFLGFPEAAPFQEWRTRLLGLGIHERILRDKEGVLEIAVKKIQGSLYCHFGRLAIYYDRSTDPVFLTGLIRQFEAWGLTKHQK